jgi:hypothetical protein
MSYSFNYKSLWLYYKFKEFNRWKSFILNPVFFSYKTSASLSIAFLTFSTVLNALIRM